MASKTEAQQYRAGYTHVHRPHGDTCDVCGTSLRYNDSAVWENIPDFGFRLMCPSCGDGIPERYYILGR